MGNFEQFDKSQWAGEHYTKFNMALMFYISLNKLIEEKDGAFINDDIDRYFKVLRSIFRKIIFKIPENKQRVAKYYTREDFLNDFDKVHHWLNQKVPSNIKELYETSTRKLAFQKLEKIDTQLTFIMDLNKMIFPDIKIEGGLDKVAEDYGIEWNGLKKND